MTGDGKQDPHLERGAMREFLRQETLRRNEETARRVNERTANDAERGMLGGGPEFLCECGSATCMERLPMTVDEFAQIHLLPADGGEARGNGTPLQFNRTHIREFSLGADWQPIELGQFNIRGFGSTQDWQ